jgi:hypothetical protein
MRVVPAVVSGKQQLAVSNWLLAFSDQRHQRLSAARIGSAVADGLLPVA